MTDTRELVSRVAEEMHHASCANVPRFNPDYDRSWSPWENLPTPAKDAWLAIAKAAIEATGIEQLIRRNGELEDGLRFYANPEIYKPSPHGLAFDDRDLSYKARAVLEIEGE